MGRGGWCRLLALVAVFWCGVSRVDAEGGHDDYRREGCNGAGFRAVADRRNAASSGCRCRFTSSGESGVTVIPSSAARQARWVKVVAEQAFKVGADVDPAGPHHLHPGTAGVAGPRHDLSQVPRPLPGRGGTAGRSGPDECRDRGQALPQRRDDQKPHRPHPCQARFTGRKSTRTSKNTPAQRQANQALSAARAPVEHGHSDLKNWRILTRLRLNPGKATTVLRALLVLTASTPPADADRRS